MARTLNGNTTGAAAHGVGEDDLTRPTDAILAFIKANTDALEYQRRFDRIYSDFRWLDYEMYVNELRAWRAEIAEAQAARDTRRGEQMHIQTGQLVWKGS